MKKQNTGWIKLHRKMFDNPLWGSEPFTKAQAWVDMLLLANREREEIHIRGNLVVVERGQIAKSEENLAKRWQWSRSKVRRFLTLLHDDGCISFQAQNDTDDTTEDNSSISAKSRFFERDINDTTEKQKTIQQKIKQKSRIIGLITVVNYPLYQQNDTTEKQKTIQQTIQHIYKEDKEDKVINKLIPLVSKKETTPEDRRNPVVNHVLEKFVELVGMPPIETHWRRQAWALAQKIKGRLKKRGKPTDDENLMKVISLYFAWIKGQDWSSKVVKMTTVREHFEEYYAEVITKTRRKEVLIDETS